MLGVLAMIAVLDVSFPLLHVHLDPSRKEKECSALSAKIEDEASLGSKYAKQMSVVNLKYEMCVPVNYTVVECVVRVVPSPSMM